MSGGRPGFRIRRRKPEWRQHPGHLSHRGLVHSFRVTLPLAPSPSDKLRNAGVHRTVKYTQSPGDKGNESGGVGYRTRIEVGTAVSRESQAPPKAPCGPY